MLEAKVDVDQFPARLGSGGGILTDYLMEHAGLDRPAASKLVDEVAQQVARGLSPADMERAGALTRPMVEAAWQRQAADLAEVIALMRRYPPPAVSP